MQQSGHLQHPSVRKGRSYALDTPAGPAAGTASPSSASRKTWTQAGLICCKGLEGCWSIISIQTIVARAARQPSAAPLTCRWKSRSEIRQVLLSRKLQACLRTMHGAGGGDGCANKHHSGAACTTNASFMPSERWSSVQPPQPPAPCVARSAYDHPELDSSQP